MAQQLPVTQLCSHSAGGKFQKTKDPLTLRFRSGRHLWVPNVVKMRLRHVVVTLSRHVVAKRSKKSPDIASEHVVTRRGKKKGCEFSEKSHHRNNVGQILLCETRSKFSTLVFLPSKSGGRSATTSSFPPPSSLRAMKKRNSGTTLPLCHPFSGTLLNVLNDLYCSLKFTLKSTLISLGVW